MNMMNIMNITNHSRMMNSSTITTTKLTAVTPAFQMTLFLLQQPRPPDVLSVHVVVKAAVGV